MRWERQIAFSWLVIFMLFPAVPRQTFGAGLTAGNTAVGTNAYPGLGYTKMSIVKTVSLGGDPWDSYGAMAIDPAGLYAYVYTDPRIFSGEHPSVSKVRLSDMTVVGTLALPGAGYLSIAVMDPAGAYVYFGGSVCIVKIRLSDFTESKRLTLGSGEVPPGVAVIDAAGAYAYFGANASPGVVVKVRLSDLTKAGALTLGNGETALCAAVIDPSGTYAYFGNNVNTDHGIIAKIRLSDMTEVASLPLASGEAGHCTAVIDASGTYAYFGTNTVPTKVVKISLGDFKEVGSLWLDAGETLLHASVIDPADQYAYFGSWTSPGKVVKVRLSDFKEESVLNVAANEKWMKKACIDPLGKYAYFESHTDTGDGHLIKVDLTSNNAENGINNANRATKAVLPEDGDIKIVWFYSHQAAGHLRLAIYDDGIDGKSLKWQSPEITNTTSGAWLGVPISLGTPSSLTLPAGTYWLAFNTDTTAPVASYSAGVLGDGFRMGQAYGLYPSFLDWADFQTVNYRWSEYLTYTPPIPVSPTNVAVSSVTTGEITWGWTDNSDNENGFKVWADQGMTTPTTWRTTTAADTTQWTQGGLSPNTQYTVQVAATNIYGDSSRTAPCTTWTLIQPVAGLSFSGMTANSIMVAPAGSFSNLTAGLSGIYLSNDTAGTASGWVQSTAPWSSGGLTPNTLYAFRGRSRNGARVSGASASYSQWTLAPPPVVGRNIVCDLTTGSARWVGTTFNFSNPAGFGTSTHGGNAWKVSGYRWVWDNSPVHDPSATDPVWSSGAVVQKPTMPGTYYLHLMSLNAEGIAQPVMLHLGPFPLLVPSQLTAAPTSLTYLAGSPWAVDVEHGGAPTTRTLTLTNIGGVALNFTGGDAATPGLRLGGAAAGDYQIAAVTPSTATPLAGGGAVTVTIRFAPVETRRTLGLTATLQVTCDSTVTPTISIPLTGDAVPVGLSGFGVE